MSIKQIQLLLEYLGYSPGEIDGELGPRTKAAVRAFQAAYGLTPDGIPGDQTQKALKGAVAGTMSPVICMDKEDTPPTTAEKPKTGDFWDEIEYFEPEEFNCKCGGLYCNGRPNEMKAAVVRIADAARKHFGRPAHVVSGLRCQKWNAHEGGVANSQHMYGEAIDLRIDGVDSETLRQFVSQQPNHRYSYCINSTNVHFDIPKVER